VEDYPLKPDPEAFPERNPNILSYIKTHSLQMGLFGQMYTVLRRI